MIQDYALPTARQYILQLLNVAYLLAALILVQQANRVGYRESLLMTLHFKGLSLQCYRRPYGDFPHCSQPAFSLVCQHYPQASAPKARAAGNETCTSQLCLTKHLAIDISSSLDSPAASWCGSYSAEAGAGEGIGLAQKDHCEGGCNNAVSLQCSGQRCLPWQQAEQCKDTGSLIFGQIIKKVDSCRTAALRMLLL